MSVMRLLSSWASRHQPKLVLARLNECGNDRDTSHFPESHFSIIATAISSQPFSASSPAMFVATMTEKSLSGASHITTYHILFEPLCHHAVPRAQPRLKRTQPQA